MFYLLEAKGLDPWLINARDVKHLPVRPKTDVLDAVWLCNVAERQTLRPSFVSPWPMRRLRDLTRYRTDLLDREPNIRPDTGTQMIEVGCQNVFPPTLLPAME